jgi:hypothetical protein
MNVRWRAWAAAFKEINQAAFDALQAAIRQNLGALSEKDRGDNGRQFMMEEVGDWIMDLGALQVLKATDREDPVHWDGGASFSMSV